MKIGHLSIVGAISAILLAGLAGPSGAIGGSGSGHVLNPPTTPTEPSFGFNIYDDGPSIYLGGFSSISGVKGSGNMANVECSSVSDNKCSGVNELQLTVIVPPCAANSDATDVCIKNLKTSDSSGAMQNATLKYEADTNKFPKDIKRDLPAGGGSSVWTGASVKGGTLDYAVIIQLDITWRRSDSNPAGQKSITGYSAGVLPVKIKSGNFYPNYFNYENRPGVGEIIVPGPLIPAGKSPSDYYWNCLILDSGRCAYADNFFPDQKIELTLQMDNAVTGWMFGRMKDTKASANPLSKNTTLLTVEGSSINVPEGFAWVPLSAIDGSPGLQEMNWDSRLSKKDQYGNPVMDSKTSGDWGLFKFFSQIISPQNGGGVRRPNPKLEGTGPIQAIEPWLKTIKATPTWRFEGINPGLFLGMDPSSTNGKVFSCTVDDKTKLHGLITTNAMAYKLAPPALNDGFLTYKVAGAHFDVDGSVYKGTYNLSMNADSAKCIYGFTDAPIQASVSVSTEAGEESNISTELVSVQNGWMNLSANNFTFSAPTIRIKLSQEKAAAKPAPSASASASPVASASASPSPSASASASPVAVAQSKVAPSKISITCVNGSKKKIVTGTKPLCPAGYKKK